jgi:hypothetical protein
VSWTSGDFGSQDLVRIVRVSWFHGPYSKGLGNGLLLKVVYGGGWVSGMLPSVYVDWVGTEYFGEGWLKFSNCLAFMMRNSSYSLAISSTFCFWISLAASTSYCTAKSRFLVLDSSSASFLSLANSASYVALAVTAVASWFGLGWLTFRSGSSSP